MGLKGWVAVLAALIVSSETAHSLDFAACEVALQESRVLGDDGRSEIVTVAINQSEFVAKADPECRGRQRGRLWCWAASLQMIFDFHDLSYPQSEIVRYSREADGSASPDAMIAASSVQRRNHAGQEVKMLAQLALDWKDSIAELSAGRPLLIGINDSMDSDLGHEYVLTGLEYRVDFEGRIQIRRLFLRNPMPGLPSEKELDFLRHGDRVDHLIKIRVQNI